MFFGVLFVLYFLHLLAGKAVYDRLNICRIKNQAMLRSQLAQTNKQKINTKHDYAKTG